MPGYNSGLASISSHINSECPLGHICSLSKSLSMCHSPTTFHAFFFFLRTELQTSIFLRLPQLPLYRRDAQYLYPVSYIFLEIVYCAAITNKCRPSLLQNFIDDDFQIRVSLTGTCHLVKRCALEAWKKYFRSVKIPHISSCAPPPSLTPTWRLARLCALEA